MGPLYLHPLLASLADSSADVQPIRPWIGPALITAAFVGWLLLLLAAAWANRPREVEPDPATMELGKGRAAIVNLLTPDWKLTADAAPATLIDLAARKLVELQELGPGHLVVHAGRRDQDTL